ncbi:hypothetical protein QQ045_018266 [Rhodiola kirilowii]
MNAEISKYPARTLSSSSHHRSTGAPYPSLTPLSIVFADTPMEDADKEAEDADNAHVEDVPADEDSDVDYAHAKDVRPR